MTVVNRFNVNKQQVTLDADIIENMSANDVSYNDSSQYKESTVGKKLSELVLEVSELIKSIDRIHKSFKVETNNKEGFIYIDGVKKTIPANSIRTFRFNNTFASNTRNTYDSNPGIASFRFLVTDTSEITSMKNMFYYCESLTSLDLSNFDTSKVTTMSDMFNGCSSLTSLDVTNFDTSKVTTMYSMFSGCSSLTSLDLSNFDTSKVTYMDYMFMNCSSLTSLDLSNFDTSKVTYMWDMFSGCSSLTSLDLSNFDTSEVIYMSTIFSYCPSLTSLDLSNFDTSAVTDMSDMFMNCTSLTNLILGPNFFKTSKVTNIDFSSCSQWTNETVVTSLVTNSYNRAEAGLNTLTLQLHTNTKVALTDEQKATITSKGYTIA